MDYQEKVALIDNQVNKGIVASAVAKSLLAEHNMANYSKPLETWLKERIMSNTLGNMLINDQRIFVIDLAKKVCCDIYYVTTTISAGSDIKGFDIDPILIQFVNDVLVDNSAEDAIAECKSMIDNSPTAYADTLVINDKLIIYTEESGDVPTNTTIKDMGGFTDEFINETCEDLGIDLSTQSADSIEQLVGNLLVNPHGYACPPNKYHVELTIAPHPNYTIDNLQKRIIGRLHYKRNKGDIFVKDFVIVKRNDNGEYDVSMSIYDVVRDMDDMKSMLEYRFGATSGKPWYRSKITAIIPMN